MFDVGLGCFASMVHCVFVMAASQVRVMRRDFVFSRFVVLGGFLVMACGMFMMFRCLEMMLCCLLRHKSPLIGRIQDASIENCQNALTVAPQCYSGVNGG
jgi:hypothetical protein